MAKKDLSLNYKSEWLNLDKVKLPSGGDINAVLDLITGGDIEIDFEITIPKDLVGDEVPKIDLEKIPDVMRLQSSVKSKTAETFDLVLEHWRKDQEGDDEAYDDAKKALDSLNSFIERCIEKLRPSMRAMVAKTLGGKAKADDLLTFGRASFDKFEIRAGAFENELSVESPLLDLSKALKRKKWQKFGVAWKADDCVISVKPKKDFKDGELKELKETLPEASRQGAKMSSGQFKADSATKVTFEFPDKAEYPRKLLLRNALQKQTDTAVHVTRTIAPPKPKGADKKSEKTEKDTGKKDSTSAKSSTPDGTKPKSQDAPTGKPSTSNKNAGPKSMPPSNENAPKGGPSSNKPSS